MSLLRSIIIGAVLTVVGLGSAQALPVYYTFEGRADYVSDPNNASGIAQDDNVQFVIMFDFDRDGYITRAGGTVETLKDSYDPFSGQKLQDTFYAEFISGNAVFDNPGVSDSYNFGTEAISYDFGQTLTHDGYVGVGSQLFFDTNSGISRGNISQMEIGDFLFFRNAWSDGSIEGVVDLVGKSDTNPTSVPEPSSLALLGLGLVGLGYARKKKAA